MSDYQNSQWHHQSIFRTTLPRPQTNLIHIGLVLLSFIVALAIAIAYAQF